MSDDDATGRGLFAGAAPSYHAARSPLPAGVARHLAAETRAGRGEEAGRLLDLGCGTGLIIEAMLPHGFGDVIGVDPDADMLAEARRHLGTGAVRLLQARAEDAPLPAGWRPDLVTAGRSLHWTDRDLVARRVRDLLPPGGVFAVMADFGPWESDTPWKTAVRRTVQAFLGEQRRAGDTVVEPTATPVRREMFDEVGFAHIEQYEVGAPETVRLDELVGFVHSFSYAAPPLFGDRLAEFDAALVEAVTPHAVNGELRDELTWSVLLARR